MNGLVIHIKNQLCNKNTLQKRKKLGTDRKNVSLNSSRDESRFCTVNSHLVAPDTAAGYCYYCYRCSYNTIFLTQRKLVMIPSLTQKHSQAIPLPGEVPSKPPLWG